MTAKILPRVGCGAVLVRKNCLLLVHRKRDPESGHWGLPGGKVDPFETLHHAVTREIFEETGLEIAQLSLLCLVEQIAPVQDQHWIAPVYIARKIEGDATVKEPDALADVKWFPFDHLPLNLTFATTKALEAMAEQGLIHHP